MSMSVYCYRIDVNNHIHFMEDAPNFSQNRAYMVFRSLGLNISGNGETFDAAELLSLVTMARAVPPIADDGMDGFVTNEPGKATLIEGSVRPGYFADAYAQIATVCEQAIKWNVEVVVA